MMKKHKKNSIWNRLKKSFVLILCLPILGLGSYMIYSSVCFVKEERLLEIGKLVEQNVLDLNNRMEQCENSLIYTASNYTLQEFLQIDESDYLKVNQASKNVGPLLYNILLSNQYYQNISVYTDKKFSVMSDLLKSTSEVEKEEWYTSTLLTPDICWWYEEGEIFLTKRITTAYPVNIIGVIRVKVKRRLFDESFQIFEKVPIRIVLNEDAILFQNQMWKESYYSEMRHLRFHLFKVRYEVNHEYIYPITGMTFTFPVIIILAVLFFAGCAISVMLRILVKEVDYLVDKVEEVKMGNLDVQIEEVQTDELNILVVSINEMLERIRQLIKKVYQTEIEQKELELEVLRSKISPHFLYNNLSAINWIALERGQHDIYEITTQMATFYRTALNKGKKMDSLKLELMNIKAYINLQLISHEHSFDVIYTIKDDVLECMIPTFILQPLVENAIEHGIDLLRDGRGKLIIRAYQKESVLYLEVEDNGKSLFEKIGNNILTDEDYGYGTSNVNKRIQLVHGNNYGLKIYASERGTLSVLRLKKDNIGVIAAIENKEI